MFISILYMFQAAMCPSSGELIVSIRHLVYVTLCGWPFGVQVWMRLVRPGWGGSILRWEYTEAGVYWGGSILRWVYTGSAGVRWEYTEVGVYWGGSILRWEYTEVGVYSHLNPAEPVSSKPAHQTVIYTEWHTSRPDVVLIQLILLMMGTWLPETCRE